MFVLVYNPNEYTIEVRPDGTGCEPHSWEAADEEHVNRAIDEGRLFLVDMNSIDEHSHSAATMAKNRVEDMNRQLQIAEEQAETDKGKGKASRNQKK
jgi:hypothetical protein